MHKFFFPEKWNFTVRSFQNKYGENCDGKLWRKIELDALFISTCLCVPNMSLARKIIRQYYAALCKFQCDYLGVCFHLLYKLDAYHTQKQQ